jgi:hypothetical protein
MSGSNSRAPNAEAEALSFTVHNVAEPGLESRRTRNGRLKMLAVLLVCAAPVIASYFTYFVIRPEGRTNYGELILPTKAMPALPLRQLDGTSVAANTLKGQWLLVVVGPSTCGEACEKQLLMQRQLREMLGRDRDRLDKLWLITDGGQPAAALRAAAEAAPSVQILQVEREALASWLSPADGHSLEQHLYVVDPMGDWMMRMPADPEPARVKRDLERLMRGSSGWDKPGR